ncbi:MAG: NADH-quinone oxidoreductase subunit NuoF [Pseudomonadota bacterium]
MRVQTQKDLDTWRDSVVARQGKTRKHVLVCGGPGCLAAGSARLYQALQDKIRARKLDVQTTLRTTLTGCHGLCERGPLVIIEPGHLLYPKVKPTMLDAILDASVVGDGYDEKLAYRPTVALAKPKPGKKTKPGAPVARFDEIPFYKHQHRLTLRHCGVIDPESIEDAIAHGAYRALVQALTSMTPADVLAVVDRSGLRGRGGAGFATGRKWKSCIAAAEKREAEGEGKVPRHVLCNGDEGDPGAFMDRVIMEGDPHAVVEGMILGAYALGSQHGWIYVREEYPLAVERLGRAIVDARTHGLLGEDILGTGFCFDLTISRGGGAFVCGESSALMQSVAGNVGEPRAKYVRSVERGLFDEPTVLNNVETWTCVPWILEHGAEAFASIGPKKSPGTKAFSLSGTVRHTGLIEVPMGVTLRHIIYDVGGGILNERPFKAVQTGGPSGGCLPESCLDLHVDFDSLTKAGAMMGSGGMIVMDDFTCMVDVARYFTRFLTEESCGKCVPCREGLTQLLGILDRICRGEGRLEDLDSIENIAFVLEASLCALGTSAMNPVMSTLKYFRDEYIEHIEHKRCRAGVCTALSRFEVLDSCTGCLVCKRLCPVDAIAGEKQQLHLIDQDTCTHCGVCIRACTFDAIKVI